jgi:hypothetical protein
MISSARFHSLSRAFTALHRHNTSLADARKSCHDLLMQDRLIVLALLATAACVSAFAQLPQFVKDEFDGHNLRPIQNEPTVSQPSRIDFDHTLWEAQIDGVTLTFMFMIGLHHGSDLDAISVTEGATNQWQVIFSGTYAGQTVITGRNPSKADITNNLSLTIMIRQKKSWVVSGSGSLASE